VSSAETQLAAFIAKFSPEMAKTIRACRKKMRALVPSALELVYDNYNFFVIGYGPTERTSEAIFSLACQASGVSLFFLQGAGLPDPKGLLQGNGRVVRSIKLESPETLGRAEVRALVRVALNRAKTPLNLNQRHALIIRSVSATQRPRRK
jgi:hypothetical protein